MKTIIQLFILCCFSTTVMSQNINVSGLTIDIPDGDITPETADNTDFGSVTIPSSDVHTFVIVNNVGSCAPKISRI